MQTTTILSESYLDILFANRNRSYGAYELRSHYQNRALTAAALVVLLILAFLGLSFIKSNGNASVPFPDKLTNTTSVDLKRFPVMPQKPEPAPSATNNTVKKYTTFVVKKDEEVKEKVTEVKDLTDKQIGTKNIDGEDTDSDESTNAKIKGDPVEKPEIAEPPVTAAAVRYSSVMPDFNGNLNTYLNKELKYPSFARENDIQGRVTIEFIVNEDGSISGARILKGIGAGCDDEALRVVKAMPRWKPGMNNGKAVKVYVILPINFQLN